MTPERMLEATFQRLSDWTDARFGVGCFGLARRVAFAAAASLVVASLVMRGVDDRVESLTYVLQGLSVGIALLAASAYLGSVERRLAASRAPAVIAWLRNDWAIVTGFALCALGISLYAIPAYVTVRLVIAVGLTPTTAGALTVACLLAVLNVGCPCAFLLACCEWRGRPSQRVAAPSRASASPG